MVVKDTIPPVVPILATVTGQCSATVPVAVTTDAVTGAVTGTTSDPLVYSTQGTFTVHWTFTDGNGNSSTANQTVIVKDTVPPVVPILATVTGQSTATVPVAITTDACAGLITGTTSDPLVYTTQGTFTVRWTFDDRNGNSSTATQTVIVKDTIPPILTLPLAPVVVETRSAGGAVATFAIGAVDLVGGTLTPTAIPPSGSLFPVGDTTVLVSASDPAGNVATGTFIVRVIQRPGGIIVYSRHPSPADRDGSIWIADLDSGLDRRITSGRWPAVSFDGARLNFQRLSEATPARGHLFQRQIATGQERLFGFNYSQVDHQAFVPDGTRVVFNSPTGEGDFFSAEANTRVVVQPDGSADAKVLFGGQALAGVAFHGGAVDPISGALTFYRAASARLNPSDPLAPGGLYVADADGRNMRHVPGTASTTAEPFTTVGPDLNDYDPVWSPDGQWLAFREGTNVFKIRPSGLDRTQLTVSGSGGRQFGRGTSPMGWSPDGKFLVVALRVDGVPGLYSLRADGSGVLERLKQGQPLGDLDVPDYVGAVLPSFSIPIASLPTDSKTTVSFVPAGSGEHWIVPPVTNPGAINQLIPVASIGTKLLTSTPGAPEVGFVYGAQGWVPDLPLSGPTTAGLRVIFPDNKAYPLTFSGQAAAIAPLTLHFGDNLVGNPGGQALGLFDLVGVFNPAAGLEIRFEPVSDQPDYQFSRVRWIPGLPVFNPGQVGLIHVGGPMVVRQPESIELQGSRPNELSVSVLAGATYSYQWFKDGVEFPGATGPVLSLDGTSPTSPGDYQVVITGGGYSTPSETVHVRYPPLVVVDFVAPVTPVTLGGTLNASIKTAGGLPPYRFQWFRYGRPLVGQTGPTLQVSGFGFADAGPYAVDVLDQAGERVRREFAAYADINPLPFTDDLALGGQNGFANQLNGDHGFGLGDNSKATFQSPGEPVHGSIAGGASIWLTWRPTVRGIATLSTEGSIVDTVLAVYRLKDPKSPVSFANLDLVTANDDAGTAASTRFQFSELRFNTVAGGLYFIVVDGKSPGPVGQTGPGRGLVVFSWDLRVTQDVVPEISVQPKDTTTSTNSPLTLSLNLPPDQLGNPNLSIQWYKDDQILPGLVGNQLIANPGNNPAGLVGHYMALVSFRNSSGQIEQVFSRVVDVQLHDGSPLNRRLVTDDFQKKPPGTSAGPQGGRGRPAGLTLSSSERHYFSAVGGTAQPREPRYGTATGGVGQPVTDSYWYFVEAPATGVLVVDTSGSQMDTRLDIFDPASDSPDPGNEYPFDGLKELSFNDNASAGVTWSRVGVPCVQGQTFFVRVSGTGASPGLVQVNINSEGPLGTPTIAGQFEAVLGHPALLAATVTNAVPAVFQWYIDSLPLPGQTNQLLTLDSAQVSDHSARFSVELTSLDGEKARSASVALSVLKPFTRLDPSTLCFAFDDLPIGQYKVQSSSDLIHWKDILTKSAQIGEVFKLTNTITPQTPLTFFRILKP